MGADRRPEPPGRPVQPPRLPPPGYPDCCEVHRRLYEQLETGRGAANEPARPDPWPLVHRALDALFPPRPSVAWQVRALLRARWPRP